MRRRKNPQCPKCTRSFSPRKRGALQYHIGVCKGVSRGKKIHGPKGRFFTVVNGNVVEDN